MEEYTGALVINKTRKDTEYRVKFTNHKGKEVSFVVPPDARHFDTAAAVSGDEAHIELEGQVIRKCTIPGKPGVPKAREPKKPQAPAPASRRGGYSPRPQASNTWAGRGAPQRPGQKPAPVLGKAPYNFVRYLPSAIVPAPEGDTGRWSGEIICRLTAETPLLVSGRQVKDASGITTCAFLQVDGVPVIPGTAIKGMLRSCMEILSFSGLRPVSRKKLFWRTVAEGKYRALFPDGVRGGFLRKTGADFSLIPVKVEKRSRHAPKEAGWEKVQTGGIKTKIDGVEVESGSYFFSLPEEGAESVPLDRNIVLRLFDQMTPGQEKLWPKGVRQRRLAEAPGLPVFYREMDGKIAELGFCRYFRVQYEYSPHDLAWPDPAVEQVRDLARAIFGHVEKMGAEAGRVAIESCQVHGTPGNGGKPVQVVGAGPKPTCVPFYLVQDPARIGPKPGATKNSRQKMVDYNDRNGRLRGRKLYWHHDVDPRLFPTGNDNEKVAVRLLPLAPGASGEFAIRVDRLSDIELGCLLEALELREGCRHKLGMGKPLGFGSVKLEIREARLADVRRKYASLAGRLAEVRQKPMDAGEREALRAEFRNYILERAEKFYAGPPVRDFYRLPPIHDLFLLLDWERRPRAEEVANMPLQEFRKYPLLPMPDEVV